MPERNRANQLTDAYFARVHLLYPFVHEPSFRSRYEHLWTGEQPKDLAWLAVVNVILAYGCEFCPHENGIQHEASVLISRAKRILLSRVFEDVGLDLAQALLLLCHYLQGALELNECWNLFGLAIRSSIAIGLHIDPSGDPSINTIEREVRKRVWWGCFVLDRTLCMKFGRPPSIALDDAINVEYPAEVDDQYIMDLPGTPRQPASSLARPSFFVQTIGLSKVIDSILAKLYLRSVKGAKATRMPTSIAEEYALLGNIVLVDGQLEAWWRSVPLHLKIATMETQSLDLGRQRNVLYLRYIQMRLLLLRPAFILLHNGAEQDPFVQNLASLCARRCLSVARETVQQVYILYPQKMLHSMWYILHCGSHTIDQSRTRTDFRSDMFSAVGVLLSSQTLGISTASGSAQTSDAAVLDEGMGFFRLAGQHSSLAQRYLLLLEKFRARGNLQPSRDSGPAQYGTPNAENVYTPGNYFFGEAGEPSEATRQAAFDPTRVSFPDPNDFLFGMGLPQDLLTTDWAAYSINLSAI